MSCPSDFTEALKAALTAADETQKTCAAAIKAYKDEYFKSRSEDPADEA